MRDKTMIRGRRTYGLDSELGEGHRLGDAGKRYSGKPGLNFDADLPTAVAKSAALQNDALPALTPSLTASVVTPTQAPAAVQPKPQAAPRAPRITKHDAVSVPLLLTWEAVEKNIMPSIGDSGLPKSLERDVPPEYRYWKCEHVGDAVAVRNALVETGMFSSDTLRVVDGELRRVKTEVVKQYWLESYDDSVPVVVPPRVDPLQKFAEYYSGDRQVLLVNADHTALFGVETVMQTVRKFDGDWIVAARDSAETRASLGAPCFKLRVGGDDLVFATLAKLDDTAPIVRLNTGNDCNVLADDHEIRLMVKSADERIIFGIVLEPDTVDAQGDTISTDEIRQAAHKFMEDFGQLGLQHREIVNGKLKLLESFIAPVDFDVDGQSVKKGTWLMAERVVDDTLWVAIKKGDITGYSIGGSAVRRKIAE